MASLRDIADRYAARAQLTAGSEVDDLTELVLNERPDVKRASARAAARAALGLADETPPPVSSSGGKRRRPVPGKAAARKAVKRRGISTLGMSGAGSVGGIVAQMLGLVVLYFVLTNAGTASGVLASARSAVEWVLQPVPLRR